MALDILWAISIPLVVGLLLGALGGYLLRDKDLDKKFMRERYEQRLRKWTKQETEMQYNLARAKRIAHDAKRRTEPRADAGRPAVVHLARNSKRPRRP